MSRQTTLGRFGFKKAFFTEIQCTVMETNVPDFVKLKTYNCIVFTDFQHTTCTTLYFSQPQFFFLILNFFLFESVGTWAILRIYRDLQRFQFVSAIKASPFESSDALLC